MLQLLLLHLFHRKCSGLFWAGSGTCLWWAAHGGFSRLIPTLSTPFHCLHQPGPIEWAGPLHQSVAGYPSHSKRQPILTSGRRSGLGAWNWNHQCCGSCQESVPYPSLMKLASLWHPNFPRSAPAVGWLLGTEVSVTAPSANAWLQKFRPHTRHDETNPEIDLLQWPGGIFQWSLGGASCHRTCWSQTEHCGHQDHWCWYNCSCTLGAAGWSLDPGHKDSGDKCWHADSRQKRKSSRCHPICPSFRACPATNHCPQWGVELPSWSCIPVRRLRARQPVGPGNGCPSCVSPSPEPSAAHPCCEVKLHMHILLGWSMVWWLGGPHLWSCALPACTSNLAWKEDLPDRTAKNYAGSCHAGRALPLFWSSSDLKVVDVDIDIGVASAQGIWSMAIGSPASHLCWPPCGCQTAGARQHHFPKHP